ARGKEYQYLTAVKWWKVEILPSSEVTAEPIPSVMEGVDSWGSDWLCFAVQCQVRGWDDLASAAYAKARHEIRQPSPAGFPEPTVMETLCGTASWFWERQLTERHSDRKDVLRRLDDLARADGNLDNWRKSELGSDLALTLAPRKSKPGSVEGLIDDLTEFWDDPEDWDNEVGQTAYWKLVELGFDAIPALMDHL